MSTDQASLSDEQIAFHRDEYSHLREELMKVLDFAEKLLPANFALSLAFYAWIITNTRDDSIIAKSSAIWNSSLFLPLIATAEAMILSFGALQKIQLIGGYLKRLEDRLGISNLGWEKHVDRTRILNFEVEPHEATPHGVTPQIIIAGSAWLLVLILNFTAMFVLWK